MSKNLLLFSLIAGLGVGGCAAPQRILTTGCDSQNNCSVAVNVTNCIVTVEPETLSVPPPRQVAKKITWELNASSDYMFAPNGIEITNPDGEFDGSNLHGNGKKFKWNDKHTKAGDYKYSVSVYKTGDDPKACPKYDPLISNQ
ncbi:MAG: hypothetical protein ABI809_11490 [Caldimonas sp.]